jgi:hypothetical protein
VTEYTLAQAAHIVKGTDGKPIAPVSLRAAIHRGYLRATKRGKTWYVSDSELARYQRQRPRWFKPQSRT